MPTPSCPDPVLWPWLVTSPAAGVLDWLRRAGPARARDPGLSGWGPAPRTRIPRGPAPGQLPGGGQPGGWPAGGGRCRGAVQVTCRVGGERGRASCGTSGPAAPSRDPAADPRNTPPPRVQPGHRTLAAGLREEGSARWWGGMVDAPRRGLGWSVKRPLRRRAELVGPGADRREAQWCERVEDGRRWGCVGIEQGSGGPCAPALGRGAPGASGSREPSEVGWSGGW